MAPGASRLAMMMSQPVVSGGKKARQLIYAHGQVGITDEAPFAPRRQHALFDRQAFAALPGRRLQGAHIRERLCVRLRHGEGLVVAAIFDNDDFSIKRLLLQKCVNLSQTRWQARFFIVRRDNNAQEWRDSKK